jgi:sugar O-acyltransferase (sialic acid O-acetyltransferase NeuD family)
VKELVMVVTNAGSMPRIAIDIAALSGTPIVGVVQFGTTEVPFVSDLPALGGEGLLESREFLDRYGIINGVQGGLRGDVGQQILAACGDLPSLVHPTATIAASATLGEGCIISAGAIVNVDACIGRFCIINSAATIDHDNVLEESVTIGPGAHLAGHVTVGFGAFIGIGATVIGGVTIRRRATVGAGAVVIRDVPEGATVVGNPARVVK